MKKTKKILSSVLLTAISLSIQAKTIDDGNPEEKKPDTPLHLVIRLSGTGNTTTPSTPDRDESKRDTEVNTLKKLLDQAYQKAGEHYSEKTIRTITGLENQISEAEYGIERFRLKFNQERQARATETSALIIAKQAAQAQARAATSDKELAEQKFSEISQKLRAAKELALRENTAAKKTKKDLQNKLGKTAAKLNKLQRQRSIGKQALRRRVKIQKSEIEELEHNLEEQKQKFNLKQERLLQQKLRLQEELYAAKQKLRNQKKQPARRATRKKSKIDGDRRFLTDKITALTAALRASNKKAADAQRIAKIEQLAKMNAEKTLETTGAQFRDALRFSEKKAKFFQEEVNESNKEQARLARILELTNRNQAKVAAQKRRIKRLHSVMTKAAAEAKGVEAGYTIGILDGFNEGQKALTSNVKHVLKKEFDAAEFKGLKAGVTLGKSISERTTSTLKAKARAARKRAAARSGR